MACIHPPVLKLLQIMWYLVGYTRVIFFFCIYRWNTDVKPIAIERTQKYQEFVKKKKVTQSHIKTDAIFRFCKLLNAMCFWSLKCHPQNTKNQMFCILLWKKWTPWPQSFARWVAYHSQVLLPNSGKRCLLNWTRSDLTFTYFTPSKVMAIVKIPTLIHLILPPKGFDIHASVRLKNERKEASFEWWICYLYQRKSIPHFVGLFPRSFGKVPFSQERLVESRWDFVRIFAQLVCMHEVWQ